MALTFVFILMCCHLVESEKTNLELEVEQLKSLVEGQRNLVEEQRSLVEVQRSLVERQRDELAAQQAMIQSLSAKISNLESAGLTRDRRQQHGVAFTAYLDHREQEHPNSVIRFNQVLYNLGNAFNVHTGYFTAPVSGTYIFSFHIEEYDAPDIRAQLLVDGQHQVSAIVEPRGKSTQSGNTAIIWLSVGQVVCVSMRENGQLYGEDAFRGTTFAGALLY